MMIILRLIYNAIQLMTNGEASRGGEERTRKVAGRREIRSSLITRSMSESPEEKNGGKEWPRRGWGWWSELSTHRQAETERRGRPHHAKERNPGSESTREYLSL